MDTAAANLARDLNANASDESYIAASIGAQETLAKALPALTDEALAAVSVEVGYAIDNFRALVAQDPANAEAHAAEVEAYRALDAEVDAEEVRRGYG